MTATRPRRLTQRLSAAFCADRRARVLLRRSWAELARGSVRGAPVGATAGHSGSAPDARARRLPAGVIGRGAQRGVREPPASPVGRGPAGREAPRPGRAHGRGGRRRGAGAAAPRLAECQARAGLAAQSARLCVPAHRGGVRVRGDHRRRIGNPHTDLARQARDRAAGAPADRCRDEVGGRDGPPAGQPGGRRPRAGPRAAAGRRPAHAGAAPRLGGGRPRDRASLPPPSGRSSSWC